MGMCMFFLQVHPLVIWDMDDWLYISFIRKAVPIWRNWNPSRVFPEIFMPMCSYIGVKCIMPITDDYVFSLMIVFGVVLSGFITAYVFAFYNMLRTKWNMCVGNGLAVALFFLLLHFLIFRSNENQNIYLFHSLDVTCYFYYVIPSLLNLTLLMILETNEFKLNNGTTIDWLKIGKWVLLIYLAVYSNLFSSYIIAVWAGTKLLWHILFERKYRIAENAIYVSIICAWILSAFFEINGGRAEGLQNDLFAENIRQTLIYLRTMAYKVNHFLIYAGVIIVLVGVNCLVKGKWNEYEKKTAVISMLCMVLSLFFLVLLCAKTQTYYMTRGDVLIGPAFFAFLFLIININVVIREYNKILIIFPLFLMVTFFEIHSGARTFAESNVSGIDSSICKAIDEDIISQIVTAVNEDEEELVLHIPETQVDNWPFATYGANRFAYSLYAHGIIPKQIETTLIQDVEINRKYGMSYDE